MAFVFICLIVCIAISYCYYLDTKDSCKHHWLIIESTKLVSKSEGIVGTSHTQQCKICGELKQETFLNPKP
jgi:hypothetical protein